MKKNADLIERIAIERMDRLFELAEAKTKTDTKDAERLARKYTSILKQISLHYRIRMPKRYADRLCEECGRVLISGIDCTVRSSGGYLVYKCMCGAEKHVFYKKKFAKAKG